MNLIQFLRDKQGAFLLQQPSLGGDATRTAVAAETAIRPHRRGDRG